MAKKESSTSKESKGRNGSQPAKPKRAIRPKIKEVAFHSRLDPLLMLGAMKTPAELAALGRKVPKGAEAEKVAEARAKDADMRRRLLTSGGLSANVGIRSLAAQMAPAALERFIATDLVSVLVDSRDGETLKGNVSEWGGSVKALTTNSYLVQAPRSKLAELASLQGVHYVEASYRLRAHCDRAHASAALIVAGTRTVPQTGKGVLVGIVDTGIDVDHRAFKIGGKTRIVHYLDQTTNPQTAYDAAQIDAGAAGAAPDAFGHGTHVTGIAAGNGAGSPGGVSYAGVAPEADIAVVKTTFNSDDITDGVRHLFELARSRKQPCVVNLSLGGHFGGHDGSTVTERTIDQLSGPGRLVVVSAGNEGRDAIHAGQVLPAAQPNAEPTRWTANFSLHPRDVNGEQVGLLTVQVWHQREDELRITLRAPNGESFAPPGAGPERFDRTVFFVEASHQTGPYSADHVTTFTIATDPTPQWLSGWSVIADEVRAGGKPGIVVGSVHAWILDRDMGAFNSSASTAYLVGMPGTAFSAITVASYATRREWKSRDPSNPNVVLNAVNLEDVSYFSSPGPTRDGVNKPEIAAPGQMLISTLSSHASNEEVPLWTRLADADYAAMQGTSMAAPYVTGALALLLQKAPDIDWAEARRRLILSTRQDGFTRPCWNPRWGYGKMDIKRLLEAEP